MHINYEFFFIYVNEENVQFWVRRGSDANARAAVGGPEFDSRLGTPVEALYWADSNEENRVELSQCDGWIYWMYVCMNVYNKK